MNFTPFTGHIPTAAAIPTIHQFAAKFGYENNGSGGVVQETRYQGAGNAVQFAVAPATGSLVEGVKFRQAESVVVVSAAQPATVALASIAPIHTAQTSPVNTGVKYQTISASTSSVNLGNISYGGQSYIQEAPKEARDKRESREEYQELMATMMQQQVTQGTPLGQGQQLVVVLTEPRETVANVARAIKNEGRLDRTVPQQQSQNEYISIGDVSEGAWQALGGGVADYLSALPLPLHHLLKYSAPADGKREEPTIVTVAANSLPAMPVITTQQQSEQTQVQTNTNTVVVQTATVVSAPAESPNPEAPKKNKKKRRSVKEKKPRPKPGEIRLTTALDGSTLYCCPECHMAYPERGLLDQHLLGHTMERRFICNICNAALKRKDHLTRHKQSHNPERPHICSVCLKAFKRKEQLTLHFVIHSGEKRHICNECGKGFYRKDHLRKHTRSHIARRVKAELSAGGNPSSSPPLATPPAPAPAPAPS